MLEKLKKFLDFMLSDAITIHFKDWNLTISWSIVLGFIIGYIFSKLGLKL